MWYRLSLESFDGNFSLSSGYLKRIDPYSTIINVIFYYNLNELKISIHCQLRWKGLQYLSKVLCIIYVYMYSISVLYTLFISQYKLYKYSFKISAIVFA